MLVEGQLRLLLQYTSKKASGDPKAFYMKCEGLIYCSPFNTEVKNASISWQ